MKVEGHGGDLIAEVLRIHGVDRIFTLSGGHLFPIYDGLQTRGMRIVDGRHELTMAFAAEAAGKLTRTPGVAALTAGPGVANAIAAIAAAHASGSPMLVLGGRAPQGRWGQGSQQEIDHLPLVASITRSAETAADASAVAERTAAALRAAGSRHRGPAFLDLPMDVLFDRVEVDVDPTAPAPEGGIAGEAEDAVMLLNEAERPVLVLGPDVWLDGAEKAARELAEAQRIPVFMTGLARGIMPSDHPLAYAASRAHAFARADLVIVAGMPLDHRLGFGRFGAAKIAHITDHPSSLGRHAEPAATIAGSLVEALEWLAQASAREREDWVIELRAVEEDRRIGFRPDLHSPAAPIHPARIYGELQSRLQRDAIVVSDSGDFAGFADRYLDTFEPGTWLEPGPFAPLGVAHGYALGAATRFADRQIVVLLGDGAAGFNVGDWDTLVRHGANVTFVCGNNGGWGTERHPMRFLYGYAVAADLRADLRYDEVMTAFGGSGETVTDPNEIGSALDRAFETPGPSFVNVVTDPEIALPRTP